MNAGGIAADTASRNAAIACVAFSCYARQSEGFSVAVQSQ